MPLAKLPMEDRIFIDQVLAETLTRSIVLARVRGYFHDKRPDRRQGEAYAG
jgi:hypothetical protein